MSEINLGLASGEVRPDDQYWLNGMSRWERVSSLAGVIIPATPKVLTPVAAVPGSRPPIAFGSARDAAISAGNQSFWSRSETRPRLGVWSPGMYILLSFIFTPLMGSFMMAQNHRATQESTWRGITMFWLVTWSSFLLTAIALHFAAIPCGEPVYWIAGYVALVIIWSFTCALPHRRFLNARTFEAAWRADWGKPVGFGLLGWMIVFTVYLLTR